MRNFLLYGKKLGLHLSTRSKGAVPKSRAESGAQNAVGQMTAAAPALAFTRASKLQPLTPSPQTRGRANSRAVTLMTTALI